MDAVRAHERELVAYALETLPREVPDIELYGPMDPDLRGGVVTFNLPGIHPHDVAQVLDRYGIAVRAGHHCTMPLHERLDLAATARAASTSTRPARTSTPSPPASRKSSASSTADGRSGREDPGRRPGAGRCRRAVRGDAGARGPRDRPGGAGSGRGPGPHRRRRPVPSDLSVIDGSRIRPMPMLLGHEASGVVESIGADVTDVALGDHVVLSYVPSCGGCVPCLSGRPALCEPAMVSNGAGTLRSGARRLRSTDDGEPLNHHLGVSAFADHAVVSQSSLVRIDR